MGPRAAPREEADVAAAMDMAINRLNTVAVYSGQIQVTYNPGVPTAQASYLGWVTFGGSISAGTATHEMGHWLGSGTYWNYRNQLTNGQWTGPVATARIRAYNAQPSQQWRLVRS